MRQPLPKAASWALGRPITAISLDPSRHYVCALTDWRQIQIKAIHVDHSPPSTIADVSAFGWTPTSHIIVLTRSNGLLCHDYRSGRNEVIPGFPQAPEGDDVVLLVEPKLKGLEVFVGMTATGTILMTINRRLSIVVPSILEGIGRNDVKCVKLAWGGREMAVLTQETRTMESYVLFVDVSAIVDQQEALARWISSTEMLHETLVQLGSLLQEIRGTSDRLVRGILDLFGGKDRESFFEFMCSGIWEDSTGKSAPEALTSSNTEFSRAFIGRHVVELRHKVVNGHFQALLDNLRRVSQLSVKAIIDFHKGIFPCLMATKMGFGESYKRFGSSEESLAAFGDLENDMRKIEKWAQDITKKLGGELRRTISFMKLVKNASDILEPEFRRRAAEEERRLEAIREAARMAKIREDERKRTGEGAFAGQDRADGTPGEAGEGAARAQQAGWDGNGTGDLSTGQDRTHENQVGEADEAALSASNPSSVPFPEHQFVGVDLEDLYSFLRHCLADEAPVKSDDIRSRVELVKGWAENVMRLCVRQASEAISREITATEPILRGTSGSDTSRNASRSLVSLGISDQFCDIAFLDFPGRSPATVAVAITSPPGNLVAHRFEFATTDAVNAEEASTAPGRPLEYVKTWIPLDRALEAISVDILAERRAMAAVILAPKELPRLVEWDLSEIFKQAFQSESGEAPSPSRVTTLDASKDLCLSSPPRLVSARSGVERDEVVALTTGERSLVVFRRNLNERNF